MIEPWSKEAQCYTYACKPYENWFFESRNLYFLEKKKKNSRQSFILQGIPVDSKKTKRLMLLLSHSCIFLWLLNQNLMFYTNYICENVSECFAFPLDDCTMIELEHYVVILPHLNQVNQKNYPCFKQSQTQCCKSKIISTLASWIFQ